MFDKSVMNLLFLGAALIGTVLLSNASTAGTITFGAISTTAPTTIIDFSTGAPAILGLGLLGMGVMRRRRERTGGPL